MEAQVEQFLKDLIIRLGTMPSEEIREKALKLLLSEKTEQRKLFGDGVSIL